MKPDTLDSLRTHAAQGDLQAQMRLGYLYFIGGGGVEENHTEAAKHYQAAANQGDAGGQNMLGFIALQQKNYFEAVEWFRLSAQQGFSAGLRNLAYCYENGYGVELNCEQAFVNYHKTLCDKPIHHSTKQRLMKLMSDAEEVAAEVGGTLRVVLKDGTEIRLTSMEDAQKASFPDGSSLQFEDGFQLTLPGEGEKVRLTLLERATTSRKAYHIN